MSLTVIAQRLFASQKVPIWAKSWQVLLIIITACDQTCPFVCSLDIQSNSPMVCFLVSLFCYISFTLPNNDHSARATQHMYGNFGGQLCS